MKRQTQDSLLRVDYSDEPRHKAKIKVIGV